MIYLYRKQRTDLFCQNGLLVGVRKLTVPCLHAERSPFFGEKMQKTCKQCGKIFEFFKCGQKAIKANFCSKECKKNYYVKIKIKIICEVCKKEFYILPNRLKYYNRRFCNKKCRVIGLTGKQGTNYKNAEHKAKCIICKKEFKFFISEKKWRPCIICSKKCANIYAKNRIPWSKGKSKETDKRLLGASKKLEGKNNPMYGRVLDRHPNWQGGKSFEPYPLGWTKTFREQIRYRDKYKCQICGIPEIENCRKLAIHHIDYNKENINPENLISLCVFCHTKTNFNRDKWKEYFNAEDKICLHSL